MKFRCGGKARCVAKESEYCDDRAELSDYVFIKSMDTLMFRDGDIL